MSILKRILLDFVVGGSVIALAVYIALSVNPLIGGIIAAAPIRASVSIGLGGIHGGTHTALNMAKGAVIGGCSSLVFFIVLTWMLQRYGLWESFIVSGIIWILVAVILFNSWQSG
jgi:uncharacterized membrane protein (GlpM family)